MSEGPGASGAPLILVVDDDRDTRETLVEILVAGGFVAVCAYDGQHALQILQSDDAPAAILLDHHMPGMDGEQLVAHLAGSEALKHIPIILMSGDVPRVKQDNVRAVLRKPVQLDELLRTVRAVAPADAC
jgi:CheY-like chemotaxis protein